MSFNIEVEGGSSVRLPTAGKYCDRDIVITATGGGGGGGVSLELFVTQGVLSDSSLTEISENNVFRGIYNLKKLDLPNVIKTGTYLCYGCTNLEEVNLPNCTTLGAYAFYNNTSLRRIDFPKLTSAPATAFRQCTSATEANLPVCTTLNSYAFHGSTSLEKLDFPKVKWLGAQVFNGCSALTALIFRYNGIVAMSNANNIFANTPIASGTGYIYVPSALVDSYKTETNWKKYESKIRAIEDYPDICG